MRIVKQPEERLIEINLESFYEWMKASLRFLDVSWGDKGEARLQFSENQIKMVYGTEVIILHSEIQGGE